MSKRSSKELGQQGEDLAAELLCNRGYSILARNWKTPRGEVDILARDSDCVVLVEVKALRNAREYDPLERIDFAKENKLRLLAREVAAKYPETNIRVDAVTLYWDPTGQPILTHLIDILEV